MRIMQKLLYGLVFSAAAVGPATADPPKPPDLRPDLTPSLLLAPDAPVPVETPRPAPARAVLLPRRPALPRALPARASEEAARSGEARARG